MTDFNNKEIYIGIISRHEGHWGMYTGFQAAAIDVAQKYKIRCLLAPHIGDSLLCRARNEVLYKFLFQSQSDYLFTLDDDIALPPYAFTKLIEADTDMIGGIYRLKTENEKRLAARSMFDIESVSDAIANDEIHEMIYISTGCILYKREFVQRMWDHYKDSLFYIANKEEKGENERVALYQPMIHHNEYLSEDWAFCQRALDIGTKIWAHFGVPCGHWGLKEYTMTSK